VHQNAASVEKRARDEPQALLEVRVQIFRRDVGDVDDQILVRIRELGRETTSHGHDVRYAERVQRAAVVRGAHGPEEHPGHHLGGDGILLDFFGCVF